MGDTDEWGPWIDHDGKGCPCAGLWVQAVISTRLACFAHGNFDGTAWEGRAKGRDCWTWAGESARVISYRIRKPRGLTILQDLIAEMPAPVSPKVDA